MPYMREHIVDVRTGEMTVRELIGPRDPRDFDGAELDERLQKQADARERLRAAQSMSDMSIEDLKLLLGGYDSEDAAAEDDHDAREAD